MEQRRGDIAQDAVVNMNTEAIGLMLEGRQDDALGLFHSALNKARDAFDSRSDEFRWTCRANATMYAVSLDEVIYPFDCSERASPDNCFRLYRHVFGLDPNRIPLTKSMAVITYNLGIIYHECGLTCVNDNMLQRALGFYKISIALIGAREDKRDPGMIPFEMALYNNLGHLQGYYNDLEGVVGCLRHVKDMFAQCGGEASLGKDAYEFFQSRDIPQSHLHKAPAA